MRITFFFWNHRLVTYVCLTIVFGTVYAFNNTLTHFLMVVPGAHLIHIPSGLKFLLVLVFGLTGALSISLSHWLHHFGFISLTLIVELGVSINKSPVFLVNTQNLHR
jgi:hypothetical protein